jgi:hypothetical protein
MILRGILAGAMLAALLSAAPAQAHLRIGGAFGGVAKTPVETLSGASAAGSASGLAVVGRNAIGGRGYNADVWVHEQHAYVGSWGFSDWNTGGEQRFCPDAERGVAVIDARNPSAPVERARLLNPRGTSVEDVVVYSAPYGPLAGRDIAVAGIQVCGGPRTDESFFRGLMAWDVTDPARPEKLGRLSTGCCTRGLHELEVQHRDDLGKTFVYASVPASEYPDGETRRDRQGRGDFRLIDVTNPTLPVEVSNWGVHRNLGGPPAEGLGCDPDPEFGHSVEPSADGRRAFVSYWDSGFIELDVTDPATPVFVTRAAYELTADGDGHSSNFDEDRNLLFSADEDFCKTSGSGTEKGFGYLRVWDWPVPGEPRAPRQIGSYKTPNSSGTKDVNAGDYTIHNPLLVGTEIYASWYTDGVRIIDVSDPANPRETAHFVPPSENNPVKPSQRGVLTNTTQVWGVAHDPVSNLIYASDMNSGLWILRKSP